MQTPYPETLERVAAWRADPEVEGILWIGSRSRGLAGDDADNDLEVYLAPAAFARVDPLDSFVMEPEPGSDPPRLLYDAQLTTLARLQAKAASSGDPDHWTYERSEVLFDRTGAVTEAAKLAAVMTPAVRRARIQHGTMEYGAIRRSRMAPWHVGSSAVTVRKPDTSGECRIRTDGGLHLGCFQVGSPLSGSRSGDLVGVRRGSSQPDQPPTSTSSTMGGVGGPAVRWRPIWHPNPRPNGVTASSRTRPTEGLPRPRGPLNERGATGPGSALEPPEACVKQDCRSGK